MTKHYKNVKSIHKIRKLSWWNEKCEKSINLRQHALKVGTVIPQIKYNTFIAIKKGPSKLIRHTKRTLKK